MPWTGWACRIPWLSITTSRCGAHSGNRAWPTLYLIDRQGDIRMSKIGEGRFGIVRSAIEYLKENEA